MLTANMKMIAECADKLAHLGEKLFNETEMKYRAGNKVRIKSLDWYNENKGMNGLVGLFTPCMKKLCGKVVTLDSAYNGKYTAIEEDAKGYYLDDSMIEGLAEEEIDLIPKFGEYSDNKPLDVPTMITDFVEEHGLPCPDDYEFKDENGNVIEAKKIVLKRKKPKHPTTYKECSEIVNGCRCKGNAGWKSGLLIKLQELLVCRDAYWRLAGDWKPDYDSGVDKFGIFCYDGKVDKSSASTHWERHCNKILDFPTAEMRDAFYENFKDLIEECKELL